MNSAPDFTTMKKLLTTLSFLGFLTVSTVTAYAGNLYYPTYSTASARASYTIGCTTYYYNPYTGQSLGSEQIYTGTCGYSSYYQTQYQYTYPSYSYSYSYPTYEYQTYQPSYQYNQYTSSPSQYYTYGYSNGSWYPGYSSGLLNSVSNSFTNTYYNSQSQGCYYQNGYQVCY